jgi:hypothetical protein
VACGVLRRDLGAGGKAFGPGVKGYSKSTFGFSSRWGGMAQSVITNGGKAKVKIILLSATSVGLTYTSIHGSKSCLG